MYPQGGGAPSAGGQAQGTALGLQLPIELQQSAARFGTEHAGLRIEAQQALQGRSVEHHPPVQGHTLTVVAGAGPPQGQGRPMAMAQGRHPPHLLPVMGPHHQLGAAVPQGQLKGRGELVLIAGQLVEQCPTINQIETIKVFAQPLQGPRIEGRRVVGERPPHHRNLPPPSFQERGVDTAASSTTK